MRLPKATIGCLGFVVVAAAYVYPQATQTQGAKPAPPSAVSAPVHSSSATAQVSPASAAAVTPRAVMGKYCMGCHNAKLKTAGLALDTLSAAPVGDHLEEWEKVARKFRTTEMPPPGLPRPDKATYAKVNAQLEAELDVAAAAKPNPGRVPVHRLNRN